VALGLTIILGVLDVADFAQGALYMAGAFAGYFVTRGAGLSFFVALPVAMAVGAVLATTNYLAVYRTLKRFGGAGTFIGALGLLLILSNLALFLFGAEFRLIPAPFAGIRLRLAGASMTGYQAFLVSAVVFLVLATWLFLQRTRTGKMLRAVSQNRNGAMIVGIPAFQVELAAFVLAGALAGGAGTLAAAVNAFDPAVAAHVVIKAFAIVIFGGMGSVPGAIVGALIVGFAETLTSGFLAAQHAELTAFVLMILILLFRPHGLFGTPEARL
jgi:branched-chain amino acid transport system permease protein